MSRTPAVIGMDVSSRKWAAAIVVNGTINTMTCPVPKSVTDTHTVLQRLGTSLAAWVKTLEQAHNLDLTVFVEGAVVAGARNIQSTIKCAMAVGAVMSALTCKSYLVPISSWKKEVIGHGQATKADIATWVADNYPHLASVTNSDQDLADAVCIALYGVSVTGRADVLRGGLNASE